MNIGLDKIRIKYFGIGCYVIKGQFEKKLWENFHQAAERIKSPLSEAIFDASFFESESIKGFKSMHDLGNLVQVSGLMNHYQSIIEIQVNNKQKRKILFKDFSNNNLLFPLYQTNFLKIDCAAHYQNSILIVEKEIGTIASYEFNTDKFVMDKLHFSLVTTTIKPGMEFQILSKIVYDGKVLIKKKSDTLVKERFALLDHKG